MWTVMEVLLAVALGLTLAWVALVVTLVIARPKGGLLREATRLVPDLIRLLTRLAKDRTLPRAARVWLWLLVAYLAMPIDLVPDFVPVVGYADDAIVVAIVLRMVVRHAGVGVVRRHWPGTPEGLGLVRRLAGLAPDSSDDQAPGPAEPIP